MISHEEYLKHLVDIQETFDTVNETRMRKEIDMVWLESGRNAKVYLDAFVQNCKPVTEDSCSDPAKLNIMGLEHVDFPGQPYSTMRVTPTLSVMVQAPRYEHIVYGLKDWRYEHYRNIDRYTSDNGQAILVRLTLVPATGKDIRHGKEIACLNEDMTMSLERGGSLHNICGCWCVVEP